MFNFAVRFGLSKVGWNSVFSVTQTTPSATDNCTKRFIV